MTMCLPFFCSKKKKSKEFHSVVTPSSKSTTVSSTSKPKNPTSSSSSISKEKSPVFPTAAPKATKHFQNANDIPSEFFSSSQNIIEAKVTFVNDGDTFRVRHLSSIEPVDYHGPHDQFTISIRLAAIDCPEIAKKDREGQPCSEEAKNFTIDKIKNKNVLLKLCQKDQYNRVIAFCYYKEYNEKEKKYITYNLSEELLKLGYATVYHGKGGEYGEFELDYWLNIEKKSQQNKNGIWKNGVDAADLPREYKKKLNKNS